MVTEQQAQVALGRIMLATDVLKKNLVSKSSFDSALDDIEKMTKILREFNAE